MTTRTFDVQHIKTTLPAQVTIRGAGGLKLFDACLPVGTNIAVVTQAKRSKKNRISRTNRWRGGIKWILSQLLWS